MVKKWAAAALVVVAALWLGSARAGEPLPVIAIGVPKVPPALPVLRMIESGAMRDRAAIGITVWTTPEQLIAMAQDPNYQMFVLPLTVAAKLHNKGVDIRLTNISTWGVAQLVTSDPSVTGWADLRGKTLFVPVRSSTPEVLTRYFLDRAGLQPGRDVEVVHSTVAEMGQLLKAGMIEHAVLLEPHLTAAVSGNNSLRVAIDFADEWKRIRNTGGDIPNAGLGATAAFLDANPELVRDFEEEYEKALDWVLAHPDLAGALAEKYLGLRAAVIAEAMPRLGLRYKTAAEAAAEMDALFQALFELSPALIGKKIPDAALYRK